MSSLPTVARWAVGWVVSAAVAIGLASWARHAWVQAPGMAVWCEANPHQAPCPWREAVIQAFVNHRLSTTALSLLALAWALSRVRGDGARRTTQGLAWLALCAACMGLVLYDTDRSAPTLLLAALMGLQQSRKGIA